MICNHCGTDNAPGAGFCAVCGANLTTQAPTTPPPAYYTAPQEQQGYPNYNQNSYPQQPTYPQQNPYQPQYNYGQTPPPKPDEPGKGMAIASLVCGIISIVCCLPIITGPLGIIFGIVAKNQGNKSGMSTAGIVCGAIGLGLWIVTLIMGVTMESVFYNLY